MPIKINRPTPPPTPVLRPTSVERITVRPQFSLKAEGRDALSIKTYAKDGTASYALWDQKEWIEFRNGVDEMLGLER